MAQLHKHTIKLNRTINVLLNAIKDTQSSSAFPDSHCQMVLERALLQMQTSWELYVRSIILDSVQGRYIDLAGPVHSKIANPPKSRRKASLYLIGQYPKRIYEPDWYNNGPAIDAAGKLRASNYDKVTAALGLTPWPLKELQILRNFVAHRSERSAIAVRELSLVGAHEPISVSQLALQYVGSQRRFEAWAAFIETVSWEMVS